MKEVNLAGIDLQDIQIFLAAAETLNYSAVGRMLGISQSTVSKSIARLEAGTKLILFFKHGGKVYLTPAGQELKRHLSGMLAQFETALTAAHRIQACEEERLRIGFPNPDDSARILGYVQAVRQEFPESQITAEIHDFQVLRTKLIANELDAIFTVLFEVDSLKGRDIAWKVLQYMPLCVFVSEQNPLSKKDKLTFADLRNERFIVHSPSMVPGYLKMLNESCAPYGFTPLISKYTDNFGSFLMALLFGEGIIVGDELMASNFPPNVRCYPMEGTNSGKVLAWNENNTSKCLQHFIRVCSQ